MDKRSIRERVWDDMEEAGVARFPFPPHGRIPNFAGADEAAELLAGTEPWEAAGSIKANPDAPQRPARLRALEQGTVVYQAVPRLTDEEAFLELDPGAIEDHEAATTRRRSRRRSTSGRCSTASGRRTHTTCRSTWSSRPSG